MPKESPKELFNGHPDDQVGIAGAVLCSAFLMGIILGVFFLFGRT